jgi:hypothetical protein
MHGVSESLLNSSCENLRGEVPSLVVEVMIEWFQRACPCAIVGSERDESAMKYDQDCRSDQPMPSQSGSFLTLNGWKLELRPGTVLTSIWNGSAQIKHIASASHMQIVYGQARISHSISMSRMRPLADHFGSVVSWRYPVRASEKAIEFTASCQHFDSACTGCRPCSHS